MGSVHLAWQLDWSTFLSDTFLDPALSTPPRLGHRGRPERASAAIAEVMEEQNQRYPWPVAPMGSVHLAWQLDWSIFLSDTFLDPPPSTPPRLGHRGPERASAAIAEVMQDQNQRYP